jgi:hypothetical protein
MHRETGTYRIARAGGEEVRCFVPHPLPPAVPPLTLDEQQQTLLAEATRSLGRLSVAGTMVPSPDWFLY